MQRLAVSTIITPPTCAAANSSPEVTNFNFGHEVDGMSGTPGDPVAVGTLVTATVKFKDADPLDSHTVNWNWGDGGSYLSKNTDAEFADLFGAGSATASHSYIDPGVYTVAATVEDACEGIQVTRLIVVYDPTAGFVTGGGWINSPPGAYAAMPMMMGRANFGFVSKYLKGATTPIGQTEFQFQTGNLNFHSESYDWLVVAGARAQFKGTGTINGTSDHKFLLTAVDGQLLAAGKGTDRFRIKIWHADPVGGAEVVDYDNDASADGTTNDGTALGGGSIVIHK